MKFGFSTLVCPDWQWRDVLTAASDLGFDGVELRGIGKEIYLPNISIFKPEHIEQTITDIQRLNLRIPCLSSGAFLFDASMSDTAQKEAVEFIELASKLAAPYVRVLIDRDPAPGVVDEESIISNLNKLLPLAQQKGVTLLVETNGVYADSAMLKKLCDTINHPALGILWDVHHPFRYFNEAPMTTYSNLSKYIKHVHVKDSVMENGKAKYKMMGYGDIPVKEAVSILKQNNYDGFIVLEWVRRWDMTLEEPGIVLPQYLSYIKRI